MTNRLRGMALGILTVVLAGCALLPTAAASDDDLNATLLHIRGEHEIQGLLIRLSDQIRPANYLIENVNVVDVAAGTVHENYSIVVRDGRFDWVGPGADAPAADDLIAIDGDGRYATPGLTNMHVHTMAHDRDFLLQLVNGVTTIREMDGFPYHFGRRALAQRDALLIPNHSVVSMILNSSDFGGYALPVNTVEEARDAVQEQAAAGAEAIKIHNGLSNEVYHAIAAESRAVGLPLVGHIPVRVTIAEAIAEGQLTDEHFKGYIHDDTLTLTDEDYVTLTNGSGMWNTPTFVTYRAQLRGADAQAIMDGPEPSLIAPYERAQWASYVDMDVDALTRLRQNILPMEEEIFRNLLHTDARFLAGTDSGVEDMMLAGYALHEELAIMQNLGLSPLETLRTATTNAAEVMGRADQVGQIRAGFSADLLLTDASPLETVTNLDNPGAVMLRGRYIDNDMREDILQSIRSIYAEPAPHLSREDLLEALQAIYDETLDRAEAGYVYRNDDLELRASLAHDLGASEIADGFMDLIYEN